MSNQSIAQLALPIGELAYVHQVMYKDGDGASHLHVSYFFNMEDGDQLVGGFDGKLDHIRTLPLITDETRVTIMSENGRVLGETTIGELVKLS